MSRSQNARGLSAFSLVVLAAGLLFTSVGVSPLFAEETLANGSDVNQVVDSDVAGESDSGLDAPSAFLTEGQSKDSLASIGDSNSATSEGDISVDDAAIKNKGTLLDGATYVFAGRATSRKVWDVAGGSSSNGSNVQLYNSNMTKAQRWLVHEDENGFLTFENAGSGLVLDVSGGIAERYARAKVDCR